MLTCGAVINVSPWHIWIIIKSTFLLSYRVYLEYRGRVKEVQMRSVDIVTRPTLRVVVILQRYNVVFSELAHVCLVECAYQSDPGWQQVCHGIS
jgi:hypothetical protein